MWKAFVCAALNRNRLPAWIRIIVSLQCCITKLVLWFYVLYSSGLSWLSKSATTIGRMYVGQVINTKLGHRLPIM